MKTLHFKIAFLLWALVCPWLVNAQSECVLTASHGRMVSPSITHVSTSGVFLDVNDMEFCINVNVHNIARTDGTGGVPTTVLNAQVDLLNDQFSGTGIHFEWDGNISNINSNEVYDTEFIFISGACRTGDLSALDSFDDPNAIDLFFHGADIDASASEGVLAGTKILFTRSHAGTPIVAHEMGHTLGLFHVYHGTIGVFGDGSANETNCENNDGFIGHVAECPPGSGTFNGDTAGDYVRDTDSATTDFSLGVGCSGEPENMGAFPCGTPYGPQDLTNFMRSTGYESCRDNFTLYQSIRMKYFLWEAGPVPDGLPIHSTIVECPTDPPTCVDCEGADSRTQTVFETANPSFTNACEYTIEWPTGFWDECVQSYRIEWNGEPAVTLLQGDDTSTIFATSGTYPVTITEILTSDVECTFTYDLVVSTACDPEPDCSKTCSEIMDRINSSLTPLYTNPCWSYSIDIPAMDGCYTGTVNWGEGGGHEPMILGTTMTHMYSNPGPYTIRIILYDADGRRCEKKVRNIQINCSSKAVLFPNPTSGTFEVQTDKTITQLTVRSIYGKTVHVLTDNFKRPISISNELSGIYFVEVNFDDGTSVIKKLVLE